MRTADKKVTNLFRLAAFVIGYSLFVFSAPLRADSNPGNDAGALQVHVTPNVERGVEIDTSTVNLNFGEVEMGATVQTVSPATVTITGNVTNTELDLSAQIIGGWVFDSAQTFTSTGTNQLGAWATFTSLSSAAVPLQGDEYFRVGTSSGAKITYSTHIFNSQRVGVPGVNGIGRFESNADGANMDSLVPGDKRHLWFFFRTPQTTSVTNEQQIQFTLSVSPGP